LLGELAGLARHTGRLVRLLSPLLGCVGQVGLVLRPELGDSDARLADRTGIPAVITRWRVSVGAERIRCGCTVVLALAATATHSFSAVRHGPRSPLSAAFTSVTELYLTSRQAALLATVSREDLLGWIQAG
jgi:hypothetical protein